MNLDKIDTNTDIILIYSNYSNNSKQLYELIKTPSFNLIELLKINELCIDSQFVRNRIIKSKLIKILYVPCILVVHSDGGVEQYDGSNAFNWANEILIKYRHIYDQQQEKQEQEKQEQEKQEQEKQSSKIKKQKKKVTSIIDDTDEDDDIITDDDVKEYKKMKKPPISLRIDSGNYEEVSLSDEYDNEHITSSGIKKTDHSNRIDTMTLAQAMQKERDNDFEKNKPNGMK
jgi:hypothetical protein